jgi:hypothetical protein
MALNRSVGAELNVAAADGVLKRGSKLGVLVEDCPWGSRVVNGTIIPIAKRLGITVTQSSVQCIDNLVADLAPVSSQSQSAVLKFKLAGDTSMIAVTQAEAYVVAQFSSAAGGQHYQPNYIVSSQVYAYQNSRKNATIKFNQYSLPHVFGVGTIPLWDVGPLAKPDTKAQGAAQAVCRNTQPQLPPDAFFNRAGQYAICDVFYSVKRVLEANGLRFDIGSVQQGWRTLLSSGYPAEALTGGRYDANGGYRQDGASFVRAFRYTSSDTLFRYVGKLTRVS